MNYKERGKEGTLMNTANEVPRRGTKEGTENEPGGQAPMLR
jgi:hypothetical protein